VKQPSLHGYVFSALQLVELAPEQPGGPETIFCGQCKGVLGEVLMDQAESELNGTYFLLASAISSYMMGAVLSHERLEAPTQNASDLEADPAAVGEEAPHSDIQSLKQMAILHAEQMAELRGQMERVLAELELVRDSRQHGAFPSTAGVAKPDAKSASKRARRVGLL
jgi:hypothetical protein